jgi:hypothetical protein
MAINLQTNRRFFFILFLTFAATAVVTLILSAAPPRIPQLNLAREKISQWATLATFALATMAAMSFAISHILFALQGRCNLLALSANPFRVNSPRETRLMPYLLCGVLALALFSQTLWNVRAPMDWDELDTATRLISPELAPLDEKSPYGNRDVISPTKNTRNHAMANVAALISLKILGTSDVAARLPSLFFTLLFLGVLCTIGAFTAGANPLALTLAHLTANGMFLWYTHSMRGYISMSLFTGICLFLLMDSPLSKNRLSSVALFLCGIGTAVTHTFGAIFFLILLTSYLFWVSIHAARWSVSELKTHVTKLIAGILAVPFILFILMKQYFFLSRIGFLYSSITPEKTDTFLSVLGIGFAPTAWILAVFLAILVIVRIQQRQELDLLSLFLGLSTVSIGFLILTLKATLFEARFLLAFLLPLLLWTASTMEAVKNPVLKGVLATTWAALFIVLPLLGRPDIYAGRIARMGQYGDFIKHVHDITEGVPKGCITASGEIDQTLFSNGFYFKAAAANLPPQCPRQFHLHFSRDWKGEHPLAPAQLSQMRERYHDGFGRYVYEKQTARPNRLAKK